MVSLGHVVCATHSRGAYELRFIAREVVVPPRIEIVSSPAAGDVRANVDPAGTTLVVHNDSLVSGTYRLMAFAIDPPVRLTATTDGLVGQGSLDLSVEAGQAERVAVLPDASTGKASDIVVLLSWGPGVATDLEQLLDSRFQSAVERIRTPADDGGLPRAVQVLEPLITAPSEGAEDVLISTQAAIPSQVERLEGRAGLDSFVVHVSIVDASPRSFVLVAVVDEQPILSTPSMHVDVPAHARVAVRHPFPEAPVGELTFQLVAVMVPPGPGVLLRRDRGLMLSARMPLVIQAPSL